jgi:hypothetical protein
MLNWYPKSPLRFTANRRPYYVLQTNEISAGVICFHLSEDHHSTLFALLVTRMLNAKADVGIQLHCCSQWHVFQGPYVHWVASPFSKQAPLQNKSPLPREISPSPKPGILMVNRLKMWKTRFELTNYQTEQNLCVRKSGALDAGAARDRTEGSSCSPADVVSQLECRC